MRRLGLLSLSQHSEIRRSNFRNDVWIFSTQHRRRLTWILMSIRLTELKTESRRKEDIYVLRQEGQHPPRRDHGWVRVLNPSEYADQSTTEAPHGSDCKIRFSPEKLPIDSRKKIDCLRIVCYTEKKSHLRSCSSAEKSVEGKDFCEHFVNCLIFIEDIQYFDIEKSLYK